MKVRPVDANVDMIYQCSCGNRHWCTFKEAQVVGFRICCGCGEVLVIEPIAKLNIQITYKNSQPQPTTQVSSLYQQAINALINSGYNVFEARTMLDKVNIDKCSDTGEVVKKALETL